jgi:hypothetical protein
MRIQAYLTAAAINLKRLAAALLRLLCAAWGYFTAQRLATAVQLTANLQPHKTTREDHFFNEPIVHWYHNIFSHVPWTKVRRRMPRGRRDIRCHSRYGT